MSEVSFSCPDSVRSISPSCLEMQVGCFPFCKKWFLCNRGIQITSFFRSICHQLCNKIPKIMIKLLISWSEHNKLTDTVIFTRFGFNSIFQMFACNQHRNSNLRMVLFTQQLLQIFLLNHTNLRVDLFTGSHSITWGNEWLH